jgi:hypothetical protein
MTCYQLTLSPPSQNWEGVRGRASPHPIDQVVIVITLNLMTLSTSLCRGAGCPAAPFTGFAFSQAQRLPVAPTAVAGLTFFNAPSALPATNTHAACQIFKAGFLPASLTVTAGMCINAANRNGRLNRVFLAHQYASDQAGSGLPR